MTADSQEYRGSDYFRFFNFSPLMIHQSHLITLLFGTILAFSASEDRFQQFMNAKIDKDGLLADEATFRKQMNLDELERTAEGQKESEKLWRKRFSGGGVLTCASPAIADGKLYIRLKNGLACYNLARQ